MHSCIKSNRAGPGAWKASMDRREFLRLAATAGGLALNGVWTVGCGSSESDSPKKHVSRRTKWLRIGTAVHMYTIDPAVGFDTAIYSCLKGLYDALFRYVGNPPKAIPWLARNHRMSKDAMEWTFELFPNAVFHDGSPVTAHAVKYSALRLLRIGKGAASQFSGLIDQKSIAALDDLTVRFKLLRPYPSFTHTLTWLFIVNPTLLEANAGDDHGRTWLKNHEAGSGPLTISKWIPGERYEFKTVRNYWRGWSSEKHIDGFERIIMQNPDERLEALKRGEVDIVDWAAPAAQLRFKKMGFFVVEEPSMITYEIKLNNAEGYTSNIHVRKAISYAFDYEREKKIAADRGFLMEGPMPPVMEYKARNLEVYRCDPDKARAELARSPWPLGGFSLDFVYVTGLEEERKTGEIMRDQLARLNIKVHLVPMVWADAVDTFKDSRTSPDMFPIYNTGDPRPERLLWSGYHSSQAGEWTNPGHYGKPEMDDLLQRIRSTAAPSTLKPLYQQVQKMIVEDAVNIFCRSTMDHHIFNSRVKNIGYCPVMGSEIDFYNVYLQDEGP